MPTKTQIDCPPIDMEKCGQLTVPTAGDDPILLMELYANTYKACRMRQQGLVFCINRYNKR